MNTSSLSLGRSRRNINVWVCVCVFFVSNIYRVRETRGG